MTGSKYEYVGLGTSKQYLTLYFDEIVGRVRHPREVKVRWSEFTRDEVLYEIHLAVAHRLRSIWESEPAPWELPLDLPGIDTSVDL